MEHRRVCFCMLSLLPLVQISKLSQANSLLFSKVCCRTPRGVRGLKYEFGSYPRICSMSHPSRGAWIEILTDRRLYGEPDSRTPRGVRGLKSRRTSTTSSPSRRTPRGVRGLKSKNQSPNNHSKQSHPSRGAWIEIAMRALDELEVEGRTPRGVRGLKCLW